MCTIWKREKGNGKSSINNSSIREKEKVHWQCWTNRCRQLINLHTHRQRWKSYNSTQGRRREKGRTKKIGESARKNKDGKEKCNADISFIILSSLMHTHHVHSFYDYLLEHRRIDLVNLQHPHHTLAHWTMLYIYKMHTIHTHTHTTGSIPKLIFICLSDYQTV